MRSLLMTDEYNRAENLMLSLENELEILESLEELMMQEGMIEKDQMGEKDALVKNSPYRKTG